MYLIARFRLPNEAGRLRFAVASGKRTISIVGIFSTFKQCQWKVVIFSNANHKRRKSGGFTCALPKQKTTKAYERGCNSPVLAMDARFLFVLSLTTWKEPTREAYSLAWVPDIVAFFSRAWCDCFRGILLFANFRILLCTLFHIHTIEWDIIVLPYFETGVPTLSFPR